MDTFDLLLVYDDGEPDAATILNKMLTAAPLMWRWVILSQTAGRMAEHMVLVRVTPESAGAREAIASRLAALHEGDPGNPLVWYRINKVEEEDTPRQHAMNMGLQYRDDPQNINLAAFVDAVVAAAVEEVQRDISDAVTVHIEGYHHK